MKYSVQYAKTFKRDLKLAQKRGKDLSKLTEIVNMLAEGNVLPAENKDHELRGRFAGHRECHIEPDWLLVYKIKNDVLILKLVYTGTHSDLFR